MFSPKYLEDKIIEHERQRGAGQNTVDEQSVSFGALGCVSSALADPPEYSPHL